MPDLCQLDDLKDWLGITDNQQDAKLQRLITSTSADFMNRINRAGFMPDTEYDEVVELKTWDGETLLHNVFLTNYPMNSVGAVTINELPLAEFNPATPDIIGWIFEDTLPPEQRQKIILRGRYWPVSAAGTSPYRSIYRPAPMRVEVSYSAGYDTAPPDVSQAIIEWISFKKGLAELQSQDQSTQWVQMGQFQQNTSIATSTLKASTLDYPMSVEQVIQQYRKPLNH